MHGQRVAEVQVLGIQPVTGDPNRAPVRCPHAEVVLADIGDVELLAGDDAGSRVRCEGHQTITDRVRTAWRDLDIVPVEAAEPVPVLPGESVQVCDVGAAPREECRVVSAAHVGRPCLGHGGERCGPAGVRVDPTGRRVPLDGLRDGAGSQLGKCGSLGGVALAHVGFEGHGQFGLTGDEPGEGSARLPETASRPWRWRSHRCRRVVRCPCG